MTDNEIIKALERCGNIVDSTCKECAYHETYNASCVVRLMRNALDLINRQKAEIEKWKKKANTPFAKVTFDRDKLQEMVDECVKNIEIDINLAKSEAIKEFAEELEYFVLNEDIEAVEPKCKDYESYINGANQFRHQIKNSINNLVKEMTEVETNQRKEDEGK